MPTVLCVQKGHGKLPLPVLSPRPPSIDYKTVVRGDKQDAKPTVAKNSVTEKYFISGDGEKKQGGGKYRRRMGECDGKGISCHIGIGLWWCDCFVAENFEVEELASCAL